MKRARKMCKFFFTVLLCLALAPTSALALTEAEITEQMAANSAAWWIAYYAGDKDATEANKA